MNKTLNSQFGLVVTHVDEWSVSVGDVEEELGMVAEGNGI
jgi:hypothetical protein